MTQEKENVYEMVTQTEQGSVKEKQEEKEVEGLADLGKFKDVNALMQAYRSLQAEFTRRSQRLKRYEEEAENQTQETPDRAEERSGQTLADAPKQLPARPDSTEEETVMAMDGKDFVEPICEATNGDDTMVTKMKGLQLLGQAENSAPSLYEQVMANEELRLKIVGDYLSSIGKRGAPLMRGGGGVVTAPAKKPACIADAGKMALAYLQGQKQQG